MTLNFGKIADLIKQSDYGDKQAHEKQAHENLLHDTRNELPRGVTMWITMLTVDMRLAMCERAIAIRASNRLFVTAIACFGAIDPAIAAAKQSELAASPLVEFGRAIFQDKSLSADGQTSCQSCHDPARAFSDPRPKSIGVSGKIGTRNAPSLIGIGADDAFAWDGRRARLEDIVLDPFTNPVELGLSSTEDIVSRVAREPDHRRRAAAAFPDAASSLSTAQIGAALSAFIRSLDTHPSTLSPRDEKSPRSREIARGKLLFDGAANCSECHKTMGDMPRYADGKYHHSSVGEATQSADLPKLVQAVIDAKLDTSEIGPKVLADSAWSNLGRFVVTRQPADIGAFKTPSLRNVAVTAPYMHDGSIATLSEAVDHEIYYRGFSTGHPINISLAERQALVAFLESLTDEEYLANVPKPPNATK